MLGIRIYDDYSITYHAHFNGGNFEDNNIVASSAEDLLNLLMEYYGNSIINYLINIEWIYNKY